MSDELDNLLLRLELTNGSGLDEAESERLFKLLGTADDVDSVGERWERIRQFAANIREQIAEVIEPTVHNQNVQPAAMKPGWKFISDPLSATRRWALKGLEHYLSAEPAHVSDALPAKVAILPVPADAGSEVDWAESIEVIMDSSSFAAYVNAPAVHNKGPSALVLRLHVDEWSSPPLRLTAGIREGQFELPSDISLDAVDLELQVDKSEPV